MFWESQEGMLWGNKDKWDSSIADSTKKWQIVVEEWGIWNT